MNRWVITAAIGVLTALFVVWLELPFTNLIYSTFHRFRGPQTIERPIHLVEFPRSKRGKSWLIELGEFLDEIEKSSPKSVFLDFSLTQMEEIYLRPTSRGYPVAYRGMAYPSQKGAWQLQSEISLAGFPDQIDTPLAFRVLPRTTEAFFFEKTLNISPEHPKQGLIHVMGKPGTFPKTAISDPSSIREGETVLIGPPPKKEKIFFYTLPLFPKNGLMGITATEALANFFHSIFEGHFVRVAPEYYSMGLAILVSILTVLLLFLTAPVLGIFTVVLVAFLLMVLGIAFLDRFLFLDISRSLFSIAFVYYFLIPYRLIVEYKGRWQYKK